MVVYKVTNKINNKIYIGSSIHTMKQREYEHVSKAKLGSQLYFHKAIRKHGKENFIWEIIHESECENEIREMEFHFIKQYNSIGKRGYNCTQGFDNTTTGYKFTNEQRKKCSYYGRENPNYGNKWTDEQKETISKANKGRLIGDKNPSKRKDVRKKISRKNSGSRNGMSKKFKLTDPDGNITIIDGGIKRNLKKMGLCYSSFAKHGTAKGWKLKTLEG